MDFTTESSSVDLDANQGPSIIIVSVIFSCLAALAVALRFYARRIKGLSLGLDDYVLLPALVHYFHTSWTYN